MQQVKHAIAFLFLITFTVAAEGVGVSKTSLSVPASEDQAACLLQNQLASGDVSIEEDQPTSAKFHNGFGESTSLFETESFEVANMKSIKQRSFARSKSCVAHLALLDRRTRVLEISRNVSNKKLDQLVDSFINHQSGSTDACSSQLLEAKHQLNQIHQYVIDLSMEVNATERAIMALDKELQNLMKQMEDLEKWKEEQLDICKKQTQEAIAMFGKLSDEMEEMKQIANPSVAMDIKSGTIAEASALQTSASVAPHHERHAVALPAKGTHRNITADMERFAVLVQGTQTAVSQFMQCMDPHKSHQYKHNSAALLAAAVSLKPAKHFWTKATVNKKCPGKSMGVLDTGKNDIKPCKKKCEAMKKCAGFNRGKKGAIQTKCFFFSENSCTVDTPKGKLKTDNNYNVYFITATMQFPGKGKTKIGSPMEPVMGPLDSPMEAEADMGPDFAGFDPAPPEEGEGDGEGPSAEECEAEKENLHKVYVKTYVELSRLKNEYDELANSTACYDGVKSKYESQKVPLQQDIDELLKAIDVKVKKLQGLRPRLESANEAEKKMLEQVKRLETECGDLPETISDLGKVRDAIQALSKCPGLSRVQFHLPKWIGSWVTFDQDAETMSDQKQDELMDDICDKQVSGARAGEVSEIEEQSVEGIPLTNTADVPLLGACPLCEGDAGASYADKHARVCWNSGKGLNSADKSKTCGKGLKAILCVVDQGDIRSIPTES